MFSRPKILFLVSLLFVALYRRLGNNYACLQALVNNTLTWQSSCVIANNALKTQKLFVQGYNLEVYKVIKYMQKHHVQARFFVM